ncbi:MAG: DUF2125 domain-containing protein [Aliidongia sp.]
MASLVLVLAAYYRALVFRGERIRGAIARFIEARAAHGMIIRSERLDISGFPFRLDADFGKLTVDGLPYAKPAHVEAATLVARARPWRPGDWRFVAAKGFALSLDLGSGMPRR